MARILVVDDDHGIQTLLRVFLQTAGYEIATADDGVEALLAARTEQLDLILLDVMMPNLDGHATLTQLRSDTATSSIPVVLMSASSEKLANHEGDAIADAYMDKPFTLDVVLEHVHRLVTTGR